MKSSSRSCRRRAGWSIALAGALVMCASPAFALNEPQLVSTYPTGGSAVRHGDVVEVAALYDRDLSETASNFVLLDNAAVRVPGFFRLAGDRSQTGGRRIAAFHPTVDLSESGSPYQARVTARAVIPADPTYTTFSFRIDDTPPGKPVISQPLTGEVRTDQPVVVRGAAEPGSTVVIVEGTTVVGRDRANDVGAFRVELTIPPEDGASHTIYAEAVDVAGNVGRPSATVTFWHDSVVRMPVIHVPTEGSSVNSTTVIVAGSAKPNSIVTISEGTTGLASAPVDASGAWSAQVPFSAPGAHSITASSWDGHVTDGPSVARTFTIDLAAPPEPVVLTPAPDAFVNDHDVTISGTAESGTTVHIRDGGVLRATAAASPAWSVTLPFVDGPHTISATAVDAAGNESPSISRSFIVDTIAPPVPVITTPAEDAFLNVNPVLIGGSAEPGASVRIFEGAIEIGRADANAAGAWSTSVPFTQEAHSIRAIAIDAAQNQSPPSTWTSFTVDTTPPSAPDIIAPASSTTFETAAVTITGTGEPASTIVIHDEDGPVATTAANASGDWSVTVTFSNGEHTVTARAVDAATNTSDASEPVGFTVSATADTMPPPVPTLDSPAPSSVQRGFVTFTGIAEPMSTVRIFEGSVRRVSGSADANGIFRFGLSMSSGSHAVTATATDPAGNTSGESARRAFTVDAELPSVTLRTVNDRVYLPGQPAVVQGDARDNLAVDYVVLEYRDPRGEVVLTENAGTCNGCPGPAIGWSAAHPLPPNVYTVEVYAVDRAGNRSVPATLRFFRL